MNQVFLNMTRIILTNVSDKFVASISKVQEEKTGTSWNLNMDATSSPETSVTTYQSIRRHTYEDMDLLNHNHIPDENKKQNKMWTCKLLCHLIHFMFTCKNLQISITLIREAVVKVKKR